MSVPDLPAELVELLGRYEFAFLVSIGELGPHTTPQQPALVGGVFTIAAPGPVTCRNITANPAVTLLWPPSPTDTHALIIDGHATLRDFTLEIAPTLAVLHHTGNAAAGSRRCADCRRFHLAPPSLLRTT
ncbi:pyridoxamine 5'-phosphate oxidase family protein [Nocardia sp. CDC153]|uniref:pyridoxamine 5'-phosphate oxidase family protein n=1 Tax=Nocardia sp. CDC153 TaxID=3112167 RepID=UPI002DBB5D71|nr:pyridoxamine 5'-phosphate oxidase family protein [Nocardia sp. CDC153]MEC3951997.1 pyridoxamine 5'-phosphate oxidase family protein [Nocardia sp. CDC153]